MRYAMPARLSGRNWFASWPLLVLLALCQPGTSAALRPVHAKHRADREIIEGMEMEWRAAVMSGDSATLDKLLADDFLSISSNGTLADKQGYLRGIASRQHTFNRLDISETKIRVQPSSAIVTSRAVIDGRVDGAPIHGVFRYTRVYSRSGSGSWKVVNFEATRVSGTGTGTPDLHSGVPVSR